MIEGNPSFKKEKPQINYLNVAEFFCDTIQGENFVGYPATFLRLQGCTSVCSYCDTLEVWRFGNPYTFEELFELIEKFDLVRKFREGQHLVLTGGSPMLQQDNVVRFIQEFIKRYEFKPYIEIENECTLMPHDQLVDIVDLWNNSPKLLDSGSADFIRYQPRILSYLSSLKNAWFKFVISKEEDWKEIKSDFLDKRLIRKDQVVLMPLGATRQELIENRERVVEISIRENVRYTTREHVIIWDKKTGI